IILTTLELRGKGEHPGWQRVMNKEKAFRAAPTLKSSTLPGKMVVVSLAVISAVMIGLALINREESGLLISFSVVLAVIAGTLHALIRGAE
ncbi:MAG: hypothetical protein ACKVGW_19860, partial [Verrucomicrobiia bacterium]